MSNKRAFTLIELLVVIAIIAILAGIIFPVYARAKDSANRNSDMASMNNLRSALQLYRADQGGYPPALLGYVTLYSGGPDAGNVIPADRLKGYLYPKRVDSIKTLTPAYNRSTVTQTTNAVFPPADASAVGSAPIMDLNGDGIVSNADDVAGARQAFGPADGDVCWNSTVLAVAAGSRCGGVDSTPLSFYAVSGFDTAQVPTSGGGQQTQLRYSRFWTNYAIGPSGGGGGADDDPRQLGYDDPPEDTVVTWDSYFRDYDSGNPGVPVATRRDLLLFVSGSARPWDSRALFDNSWRLRRAR
ncbi:MAG: type II secretion system protein [Armatimonadetes bacterium]|nr:type II secretion system protein [Armatimonadota bacterium]